MANNGVKKSSGKIRQGKKLRGRKGGIEINKEQRINTQNTGERLIGLLF